MTAYTPTRLLVPLVTPFAVDGGVDLTALEQLAVDALDAGAEGIVALGTTAETTSLDEEERRGVVETIAAVCRERGRALVVAAGTNDTRSTIARHEQLAETPGVDASLAVVPYYVRPSEAAIVAHFQAVADRSPVPLILYNIPYRTGRGLGASSLLELAFSENIVGVKQAVGAIDADTLDLLARKPREFAVLGGDDAFLFPLVLMGGAGAIAASANVATSLFVEMIDRALASDVDLGRPIAERLLPLVSALFAEPSPAPIKAALHASGRIATPHVRMPLADASPEACEGALTALSRALRPTAASARLHDEVAAELGAVDDRRREMEAPIPTVLVPHGGAAVGGSGGPATPGEGPA